MNMETEETTPTSNGILNHPDNESHLRDDAKNLDMSIDEENTLKETNLSHDADDVNGQVNDDNASKADYLHQDLKMNIPVSDDPKAPQNAAEGSPAPVKKKRRRSSAKNLSLGDSSDGTSRYGRTRKPKYDDEHFLPTEAVFGKSPKKGRKSIDASSTPISGVTVKAMTIPSNLNGSLNDSYPAENEPEDIGDLSDDLKALREGEVKKEAIEEAPTDYEPGDILWGRLGRHPFWPCIVMCDPVANVYYKKSGPGRSRFAYHVMFYADNGKRSWVASSMIFRFLGLTDFEAQVAGISKEMKKSNPKWFDGFFVKANTKPKWEAAVREAEEVLPLIRDQRLDAFLDAMPSKGRKSKTSGDVTEEEENDADEDGIKENGASGSPTSVPKKKKLVPNTESPSTVKKKRGRPRKIDVSLNQSDHHSPEPLVESTPGPGRPRKRKLLAEDSNQATNGETDDDLDWKPEKKLKRRKRKGSADDKEPRSREKTVDAMALNMFTEKHLDRVMDENPDMTDEDAKKYLLLLWDRKTKDEKLEYATLVMCHETDNESADEDGYGLNDSGIEEEVATVESTDTAKEATDEEQPVIIAKKKINLFRGYRNERVCQGCEKPGNTVRCRGPCAGVFHVDCARGADNAGGLYRIVTNDDEKPKKRGRKKKVASVIQVQSVYKSRVVTRPKKIYAEEGTDSDLDYDDGEAMPEVNDEEAIMKMILGDSSAIPEVSVLDHKESSEDEDDLEEPRDEIQSSSSIDVSSIADFRCGDCAVLRTPLCFVCGQATDPSGEDSVRIRCSAAHCGKHYHIECLKVLWPQASYSSQKGVIQGLSCPHHVCHTCVSDNPRDKKGRFSHEKLVRCIRCPTSYHFGNYCVPAGSEILTATQMICARHGEPPKKGNHINASWCFICSIGGSLICCDLCPSSFHIDCLKIKPPTGSYICEDCETGRYPLYNEVLWVKFGNYRWWPALSLFPSEVPDNLNSRPHKMGEFAVRFLGSKSHYWIDRGRCYVYHEGDGSLTNKTSKSSMDSSFQRGLLEAKELHKAHKELRASIQSQSRPGSMKPPTYTKIKSNKPMGSIKMLEVDTSNVSPCECDPTSDHPCSPDSECLNRLLLVECDPNTCPAGEKCENRYFEKRVYPALAPCFTDGRGWGLQILEDIKKGSFVIEYVGEVIDDDEYQKRLKVKHEDKDENYYFLTIDSSRIIDAGPKGNVSRFMNHSCQPNCETQKWTVAGDTRVGLFALCDIPAGTELTFNYNLESKGNDKKPCMCGASVCSGFIGAKKTKIPQSDAKELHSGKKKRRKPRVRNLIEDVCLLCDADKEVGALISCVNKECVSKYHLPCLGLTSTPKGKWYCPRHRCNVCQERTNQWCSYCTESYCAAHVDGNLANDPLHGDICETHQKNPLSKDHFKKKREEVIKRREEEKTKIEEDKRKQYEEERARRRSRREQITNDDETVKGKPRNSDLDDAGSEGSSSSGDKINEHTLTTLEALKDEGSLFDSKKSPKISESGKTQKVSVKASPSVKVNLLVNDARSPSAPSKRGRKRKVISSEAPSSHQTTGVEKPGLNGGMQRTIENNSEPNSLSTASLGEESPATSSYLNNSSKDEIPDADPALDKFIVEMPTPIDDDPSPEAKKKKLSSPTSTSVPKETSPSSITKRRRQAPVHMHKDYINSQNLNLKTFKDSTLSKQEKLNSGRNIGMKKQRDSNFDKAGLNDELQELAAGFASDDGQESRKFPPKKPSMRGRGRHLGMGVMRSSMTDSMTPGRISQAVSKVNAPHSPPNRMKSPVSPIGSPLSDSSIQGSPELLSASKFLAMQRAKGFKVMPPNRRLSTAREQALAGRKVGEGLEKAERSAKGLKVLKGRRPSVESSSSEKKTENLHPELLQSGPLKKTRPVLSKVQDNGVSLDDDVEDKVVDSVSLPKLSQPHPMQGPPNKKAISTCQKQSPAIGLSSSYWNQDVLSIIT